MQSRDPDDTPPKLKYKLRNKRKSKIPTLKVRKKASKDKFKRAYFDRGFPDAYSSIAALERDKKLNRKNVNECLSHHDTYTLHKPVSRKFKRRFTITGGVNYRFQADLIDMRVFAKVHYWLRFSGHYIDVFNKYNWGFPIKQKRVQHWWRQ
jgi:hypothetical protein